MKIAISKEIRTIYQYKRKKY